MAAFDEGRYRLMFEVQVRAPFDLAQMVLPGMRERGSGWILNISSGAAVHPKGPPYAGASRGGAVYGMCKAALERFTTGLASEVHSDGIAVNVLSPGSLRTEGSAAIPWTQRDWHERVDPSEVGPSAVYLAKQDAQSLTGQLVLRAEFGKTWGM